MMIVPLECARFVDMKELTQELLKSLVSYSPITGEFTSINPSVYNNSYGKRIGCQHRTKKYRFMTLLRKTYREHRVVFLYMTGKWPTQQVDHINQVKDDNRWCNLRDVAPAINSQNRPLYKKNTSGHTGVVWNKKASKWQVLCRANGKQVWGGFFDNTEDAGELASFIYSYIR
jgi:hypothetical protein